MQIMCRSRLSPLLIGVLLFITVFAQASKHTPQSIILNELLDVKQIF